MLSVDTNILLYAQNRDCPEHAPARAFIERCAARDDVAICELVVLEFYQLLRNPAVLSAPLSPPYSPPATPLTLKVSASPA